MDHEERSGMQLLPIEKPHCKGNGEKRVNKLPPRRREQWCGEWFCGICNRGRGTRSTQRRGRHRAEQARYVGPVRIGHKEDGGTLQPQKAQGSAMRIISPADKLERQKKPSCKGSGCGQNSTKIDRAEPSPVLHADCSEVESTSTGST